MIYDHAESATLDFAGVTVIAFAATLLLRDRTGIPLGPDHEAEQSTGQIYGMAR